MRILNLSHSSRCDGHWFWVAFKVIQNWFGSDNSFWSTICDLNSFYVRVILLREGERLRKLTLPWFHKEQSCALLTFRCNEGPSPELLSYKESAKPLQFVFWNETLGLIVLKDITQELVFDALLNVPVYAKSFRIDLNFANQALLE